MRGNITRRGKSSWRLKFDIGTDTSTGERRIEYVTVRGTRKQAEAELNKRLSQLDEGAYIVRSADTVEVYARHWLTAIAPARASAKTLERYGEIINNHIVPQLGATAMQKLDGPRIDQFYLHLGTAGRRDGKGGLAPQTVVHVHRLLSLVLASAVKARKIQHSPMLAVQAVPTVRREEVASLDDDEMSVLFRYLAGRPLYYPVVVAASTGMRRGEVLGLRWADVDLGKATLHVAQVIEETKAGIAFKEPKTERSRRTIALLARLVQELLAWKKEQAETRLKLGLGKADLVFTRWDGDVRSPRLFTKEFAREADAAGLRHVTFHGLRHTHITHLLRSGVPVHVVSARAGHANPTVTLNIYAHLLPGQQEGAAAVFDATLRNALD